MPIHTKSDTATGWIVLAVAVLAIVFGVVIYGVYR
jgi:hypothetical protein